MCLVVSLGVWASHTGGSRGKIKEYCSALFPFSLAVGPRQKESGRDRKRMARNGTKTSSETENDWQKWRKGMKSQRRDKWQMDGDGDELSCNFPIRSLDKRMQLMPLSDGRNTSSDIRWYILKMLVTLRVQYCFTYKETHLWWPYQLWGVWPSGVSFSNTWSCSGLHLAFTRGCRLQL